MPAWDENIFVVKLRIFNSKFLIKYIINRCEYYKRRILMTNGGLNWTKLDKSI